MDISLKCQCGAMRGIATEIAPEKSNRVVCMCGDCQAFAHFLGKADSVLDKNGGTDIFAVAPCNLQITQGREHLKCVRLFEKGLCRWYAGCCNTPIANTMPFARMPFAGVVHSIMDHAGDGETRDQALGPIRARIYGMSGIGALPADTHQTAPPSMILRVMRFLLVGFIAGRHTPSPFFDSNTGKPVVQPKVLSPSERENLRKYCGPKPA
jgi:hypothetical protein